MGCPNDGKVGTCAVFGCSKSRGDTQCVEGNCVCAPGSCPNDDGIQCVANPKVNCASCEKAVGSCKLFGCSTSRGATDCVKSVCVCSGDTCSLDGSCADASELPTAEYDVDDTTDLSAKDAAKKAAHVAMWTIVMIIVGGCLCASGIAYGIYAHCCEKADAQELNEQLLLG